MRIIAGTRRGRKLLGPGPSGPPQLIRPTADRAREALFSIIGRRVEGATVLDLYAGTGAFGLEALSRGAARAVFIDHQQAALAMIQANIERCGFAEQSQVLKRDLSKGLAFLNRDTAGLSFSLVFLDPPYGQGLASDSLGCLAGCTLLVPEVLVIAEANARESLPGMIGDLLVQDKRRYGDTGFWFYTRKESLPI